MNNRHNNLTLRSLTWFVILTQVTSSAAFADIKVFSKATVAPQYVSQINPPDKEAANETISTMGIVAVLNYIGHRHFVSRKPVETIQRDTRDQFRNAASWLSAIEFKSLKVDGDGLVVSYKDPEDRRTHKARIFPRDHGSTEAFGIRLKADIKPDISSKVQDLTVVESADFSIAAAENVAAEIRRLQKDRPGKDVVMVFATGNTMVGFLDQLSKIKGIDWNRFQAYHLDEYKGLTIAHPSSFAYFLNKNLFSKIPLPRSNIHYIYEYVQKHGKEDGLKRYLADMGTPDITMLGIGMDGHLAFNEPPRYSSFDSKIQEVSLDDSTVQANKKDYPALETDPSVRFAYTMGMADIFASAKIFFLANGGGKAGIVARALQGSISESVPASMLQRHPDTKFILDTAAAGSLIYGMRQEPLIGHGFKDAELESVSITSWRESENFSSTLDKLEEIIKARAPDTVKDELLKTISDFRDPSKGMKLGIVKSVYESSERYYLGFGIKKSIGMAAEFFDPRNPLYEFRFEVLFHEFFHAAFGRDNEYILKHDTSAHLLAMQIAAPLFWNNVAANNVSGRPLGYLENHKENRLGDKIRSWKGYQQLKLEEVDVPKAMATEDWKYLLNELSAALKVGWESDRSVSEFLAACDKAAASNKRHPVEARYPIEKAVTQLTKKEKTVLLEVLTGPDCADIRNLPVVDSILLMLKKEVPGDWMSRQTPALLGRSIWIVSSEVWNAGGGLGRVEQSHSIGFAHLLKHEGLPLKTCEPYYANTINKKTGFTDKTDYSALLGVKPESIREVERFEVPVGDSIAVAVCYMAVNKFGIESYLIKGYRKGQAETEVPYYTERLYHYRNKKEPDLVSLESFSAFMSKASLELTRRVEEKKRSIEQDKYRPPVMHFNDGQLGFAPLFRRLYYNNDPVLGKAMVGYSTHTYPNRCWSDRKTGEDILRYLDVPQSAWKYFYRHYETIIDQTSAGARTADWYAGVSAKHVDDILSYKYDNWGEWEYLTDAMVSVTNGDVRSATAHVFREIMLELFPGADVEEPTPQQVLATKSEAKKRIGLRGDQPVTSFSGRVVREKASRDRAFSPENIEEMVKAGIQVVIGANVPVNPDMEENINHFAAIADTIGKKKKQFPDIYKGNFILMCNIDIEVQRAILAATDIQIQDSDQNTEAAGYSEADVAACGGLELAPSWREGILQSQGIPINMNEPGEGNTIVPKDGNPASYLEAVKSVLAMYPEKLATYQANAVRLSSILETYLTSAEYFRQWNAAVERMESGESKIVKDLKGPKAPDSNTVIRDLIEAGKMFEVVIEDGVLKAYSIRYSEGYRPGKTDPNRYRGPPLDINVLFTKEEQARLSRWMAEHTIKAKTVKFRVADGQSALGWKDDIEHSNISHAGFSDGAIYIGEKLLKYILKKENSNLLEEVLDKDELEHLKGNFRSDEGLHRHRLEMVNEAMEKLEAKDRIAPASLTGSALVFKDPKNPFKKALEDPSTREVHIITAGGGGDVLGGAFMALQLRRLMAGGIKIKVFTSNLKRGDENPEGGPLSMTNVKDSFGNSISPVSGASHFYRIGEGLYADTAIKDANLNEVLGYRAKVPLSEGRIIDLLHKEGIELIMADVSQSGQDLAKDYLDWQKAEGNDGHVFVVGLDMGGDILARFPGTGKIEKDHPEAGIRSPNTDGVFLDMFAKLEDDKGMSDRVLVGVSALGGDGELGQTLLKYVDESFSKDEAVAVLDNVRFIAENDPQGDRYRGIIMEGLRAISSEVSGNFLTRLFAIARITPLLDKTFGKTFSQTRLWADAFNAEDRTRRFSQKDLFDAPGLSRELPKGVSRGYIRNKTRQEILPWAYPLTVFMRPSAIHKKIEDPMMRDTSLKWTAKDDYLRRERNYQTEMSDSNNVTTRQLINAYLLKTSVLERAWHIKERSERSTFIANELVLLRSKYRLHPGVENDLERIRSMLSENIDDITAGIAYTLSLSEEDSEKLSTRLGAWLKNTEDRLRSSRNISPYVYSYFVAHMLGEIAEFLSRGPKSSSMIDEYMNVAERLMGAVERIGRANSTDGPILSSIMAESLLPALLQSSRDQNTLNFKEKALSEFLVENFSSELKSWVSLHFIRFVLPEALRHEFKDDRHLKESLTELHQFAAEVARIFPGDASNDSTPQLKDVNILIHYFMFEKIFPGALRICPDIDSLKRFNGILRGIAEKVKTKELRYSYVFPLLDFIANVISDGKAKGVGDIEELVKTLLPIMKDPSRADKNLSPAVRFMIKASHDISTFPEIISFIKVFGAGILKADQYVQRFTYHGTVYDISPEAKARVVEILKQYKGEQLTSALKALDYNVPSGNDERRTMEEEFKYAEEEAFLTMGEKIRKGASLESLAILPDISKIDPINNFDHEADIERDDSYRKRGLKLLEAGQCAAGCTAGFVSGIALDYLSADFSIEIPGVKSKARRFIEWKLYMLERMNELYGLKNPISAVVMTAFERNDMQDTLKETGNFGYRGDVIEYHQGPTKAMDKTGAPIKIKGQDHYATPGAWGFVKWLVISGKLKELRQDRKVKYLTHSNINNPIEPVSASLIGYFDNKITKTKEHGGTVPLVMAELGDYAHERGGFACEITYKDGRKERRIVHESRLPEGVEHGDSYNLANWVLNLEGLWDRFGLDEIYSKDYSDEQALHRALAKRVFEVEKESSITPVLRKRIIEGTECYVAEYILDDISLLGHWVGVKVNRDRHFVSLKSPEDIYDYHRAQVMSDVMRNIEIEIFRKENPIVDYLMANDVIGPLQDETKESLRARVIRLFLPSRVFKEEKSLLADPGKRYYPGAYIQKDVTDPEELNHNKNYREKIINTEVGLLCAAYPDTASHKSEIISEIKGVLAKVLDLAYDDKNRLVDVITNPESNLLVRRCVRLVFFGRLDVSGFNGIDYNPYAVVNSLSNDMAIRRIAERGDGMTTRDIILEAVAAIKIKEYFQNHDNRVGDFDAAYAEIFKAVEAEKKGKAFTHSEVVDKFLSEIKSGKKEIAYVTDDNGEVVYHLYLIERYLRDNPDLTVTLVPRSRQNGIDASFDDVLQVLSHPLFSKLRDMFVSGRLKIVKDSTRMGGVDLIRASTETREALKNCDFVFSVGLVNYESIYNYSKPSYHLMQVHGKTSSEVTGYPEGKYLFLYDKAGTMRSNPYVKDTERLDNLLNKIAALPIIRDALQGTPDDRIATLRGLVMKTNEDGYYYKRGETGVSVILSGEIGKLLGLHDKDLPLYYTITASEDGDFSALNAVKEATDLARDMSFKNSLAEVFFEGGKSFLYVDGKNYFAVTAVYGDKDLFSRGLVVAKGGVRIESAQTTADPENIANVRRAVERYVKAFIDLGTLGVSRIEGPDMRPSYMDVGDIMELIDDIGIQAEKDLKKELIPLTTSGPADKGYMSHDAWRVTSQSVLESICALLDNEDVIRQFSIPTDKPRTIILQGLGEVGGNIIRLLMEHPEIYKKYNFVIAGVSDLGFGSFYNKEGIPLEELRRLADNMAAAAKRGERFVFNPADYDVLGKSEVVATSDELRSKGPEDEARANAASKRILFKDALIAIPAARPYQIATEDDVANLKVKIFASAANAPVGKKTSTPQEVARIERLMLAKGIISQPSWLINYGGIATSKEEILHRLMEGGLVAMLEPVKRQWLKDHVTGGDVVDVAWVNTYWALYLWKKEGYARPLSEIMKDRADRISSLRKEILMGNAEPVKSLLDKLLRLDSATTIAKSRVMLEDLSDDISYFESVLAESSSPLAIRRVAAYVLGKSGNEKYGAQLLKILESDNESGVMYRNSAAGLGYILEQGKNGASIIERIHALYERTKGDAAQDSARERKIWLEWLIRKSASVETPYARITRDMKTINELNMDLIPPIENGKVLYHVIAEELVPISIRGQMEDLARETQQLRERIKIVSRKDMGTEIAGLRNDKNNIVLAAVQHKSDLRTLPEGVKALVFTGELGGAYGFRQIEGIIASLRALERQDSTALVRLYGVLTGAPFTGKESDILRCIDDPRALAGYVVFNLKPTVAEDYKELKRLNNRLLTFLRNA